MHHNLIPNTREFSFKIENQLLNINVKDDTIIMFDTTINLNEIPNVTIDTEKQEKFYIVIKIDTNSEYIEFFDIPELINFIEEMNELIQHKADTFKHTINVMDIIFKDGTFSGISGGSGKENQNNSSQ